MLIGKKNDSTLNILVLNLLAIMTLAIEQINF